MSWETVQGNNGGEIVKLVNVGDELVGVYIGVVQGLHGPLYQIEVDGGTVKSLPNNKDLEEKLDPEKMLDRLVKIRFEGIKPIKGGKTFKMFSVAAYSGPITDELLAKYPSLKLTVVAGFDKAPEALTKDDGDSLPF